MDDARADLLALFRAAVDSVRAEAVMPRALPLPASGRLAVIAAGKAAAEMMRVAEARHPAPLTGLAVTRYGHVPPGYAPGPGVELIEAGHPSPDAASVRAGLAALRLARGLGRGDRLLVLLSGGGSSLLAAPAPDVTLEDKRRVTEALLRSGAAIGEINTVRKHVSAVKGGRLAAAAAPAEVITWIVSDVPGNDPSLVACGPTLADRTTAAEAGSILKRHGIAAPPLAESPKLAGGEVRVLATAGAALAAAAAEARARGYRVADLGELQGDSSILGLDHAALARRSTAGTAILSGGETTVAVRKPGGRGGPNLEYLLGLAVGLAGAPGIHALACDTDGIDGTGPAAGAYVGPDSLARAGALGLDAGDHLARNDSIAFFEALGDLVVTGPTLTNVNDFRAILVGSRSNLSSL